ncbi:Alcohol dehydrogenase 1, partial [Mucuna pruriens]
MHSDGKSRFSINGALVNHSVGTSTFSEYTGADSVEQCISNIRIRNSIKCSKTKKGSTVTIFGLGAVGLATGEGERIADASRIIGIDLNPKRFEEGGISVFCTKDTLILPSYVRLDHDKI